MKKPSSIFNTCEDAAERIQYWFGKDKEMIFDHLIKKSQSCRNWLQAHECNLVKIPRVPSQVEHLSFYGYEMSKDRKKKLENVRKNTVDLACLQKDGATPFQKVALHAHCCVNQKNPYLLEDIHAPAELIPERVVKKWQLKEHFLAFRKLRTLGKQRSCDHKRHEIVPLCSSKKSTLKSEDQEFWEELIFSKENRLFQIGRITKYLKD